MIRYFKIPSTCPICGETTRIIKDNDSEVLMCMNDSCPGKLLGKWKCFVSKKGMDIDGLSEATLDKFIKLGYLTNMFSSIYELKEYKKELYQLDGFGKKSINNLLNAIENSKHGGENNHGVDLVHFITAFSIPGIGEGQSKLISQKFPTFKEFVSACDDGYDFSAISGIGNVLNANIHTWWVNNHFQMLDVAEYIKFKDNNIMNTPIGNFPLVGKTFCVTGSVHIFKNRDELKERIEELGGKCAGSVSKNTNYLINNDKESTSGKNAKAKELGTPIISEEEFLSMIGE